MPERPIQDFYPDEIAICYGCGRHNADGLHVQTYWNGQEGIAHFTPKPYHTAFPGFVYGGLLASLVDCHSIGTAIAATYQAEERTPDTEPEVTYVTGNLNVTYLRPTPMDTELTLRAQVKELHPRKAVVTCSLFAGDTEMVRAEVVAVRVKSRATMGEP
jgi:acyl-coenzyme A thioesterase PaaI-like protein